MSGNKAKDIANCFQSELTPGSIVEVPLARSVTLKLVWCPPGTFTMGSPRSEQGRRNDETPHEVTLTRGFFLGQYQVTQDEYEEIMGTNPSSFRHKNTPVDSVSYYDALEFCDNLTRKEHLNHHLPLNLKYYLPTEAQWEYACRAGSTTPFNCGDKLDSQLANFDGHHSYNSERSLYRQRPCRVGSFEPNAWGMYDFHGNIFEWCIDGYAPYSSDPVTNPVMGSPDSGAVRRGGSWGSEGAGCRSAARAMLLPMMKVYYQGFRVAVVETH